MYLKKKNDLVPLCRRFIISLVGVPEKELKIYWRKILKKKIKEFSRTESHELPDWKSSRSAQDSKYKRFSAKYIILWFQNTKNEKTDTNTL